MVRPYNQSPNDRLPSLFMPAHLMNMDLKMDTEKGHENMHVATIERVISFSRVVPLLLLLASIGCASSYDCYSCGRVNCHYCPPNPLPYSNSNMCVCNDSIGRIYSASRGIAGRIGIDDELRANRGDNSHGSGQATEFGDDNAIESNK